MTMKFFSLCFVEVMTFYRLSHTEDAKDPNIVKWFGAVPSAMLVMTQSNCGSIDWYEVYDVVAMSGTFFRAHVRALAACVRSTAMRL